MKEQSENASEYRRNTLTARDLFRLQRETVGNVAQTYLNVRNTSEVVAVAWEPTDRSPRWNENTCLYKLDVENCVRKAFAGREDKADLEKAWRRFLEDGGTVIDKNDSRMIRILAAVFKRAQLEPRQYFRNTRCYRNRPEVRTP